MRAPLLLPPFFNTRVIACPHCFKQTPDMETKCKHCGQPIDESVRKHLITARRNKASRAAAIAVAVFILLVVIFSFAGIDLKDMP